MKYQIVILTKPSLSWAHNVKGAIESFAHVMPLTNWDNIINNQTQSNYDLFLIDANIITNDFDEEDFYHLIRKISTQYTTVPIIVAATSRTWRRAQQIIKAGAFDYILKTSDRDEIQSYIKNVLKRQASYYS